MTCASSLRFKPINDLSLIFSREYQYTTDLPSFSLMREKHSSDTSSRASLDFDCSKVHASVFVGIGPIINVLLKLVDETFHIKTCTPTPSLATNLSVSAMFKPPT